MEEHLHIVSFSVPYPVDYGGAYDVFHKIVAFHQIGIKVHLHCFSYNRKPQAELNKYCESVHYYSRSFLKSILHPNLPIIVSSRINEKLFENLLKDEYPILIEGTHCSYLLLDERFKQRRKFVRLCNIESDYYFDLFKCTKKLYKRAYYKIESYLLKKYEKKIATKATEFWTLTETDKHRLITQFGYKKIDDLPVFIPNTWKVNDAVQSSEYCLYHADLSLPQNEKVAFWLLNEIFADIKIPFVIAGKNPSTKLVKACHQYDFTCIVENPTEAQMFDMVKKAHINILPSVSKTGVKLKLLHTLFNAKYCIVNPSTLYGTNLDECCHVFTNIDECKNLVTTLFSEKFDSDLLQKRKNRLETVYNNLTNVAKMKYWIFDRTYPSL